MHTHSDTKVFSQKDAVSPQHVLPLSNTSHRVHCLSKLYMILQAVSKLLLLRMSVNPHTHTKLAPSRPSNNRLMCSTGLPLKCVLSRLKCWGLSCVGMPASGFVTIQPCQKWNESLKCGPTERGQLLQRLLLSVSNKRNVTFCHSGTGLVLLGVFSAEVTGWCGDWLLISPHICLRLPPTTFLQMALSSFRFPSHCYLTSL